MSTEDRLRAALREGAPAPLDGTAIVASAKRRRAVGLARVGAVAAALVLVGGVGPRVIGGVTSDSAVEQGPALVPPAASAPASADGAQAGAESRSSAIPGRTLLVQPERWCLVATDEGREAGCAPRDRHDQRILDDQGRQWLVVLAPSGPATAVLQVEQVAGWVSLRTSPVHGSDDLWLGVLPSDEDPASPRALRALDTRGEEIWRG